MVVHHFLAIDPWWHTTSVCFQSRRVGCVDKRVWQQLAILLWNVSNWVARNASIVANYWYIWIDSKLCTYTLGSIFSLPVINVAAPSPARATPFTNRASTLLPIPKVKILAKCACVLTKSIICSVLPTSPSVSKNTCREQPATCGNPVKMWLNGLSNKINATSCNYKFLCHQGIWVHFASNSLWLVATLHR